MARVLIFGDVAVPTGYGRIAAAVGRHLTARGHEVAGACIQYDGLLPARTGVPFFVGALTNVDHAQALTGIWSAFQPDLVLSVQDFPYHEMARHATGIDWSVTAHVAITPVDGVPIYQRWLQTVDEFDGFMTISEFGVQAFREAGKRVALCPPGVDTSEFHRLPDEQRVKIREALNIPADAFVVGVMAMNQGRKDFPSMIKAFRDAFVDVPEAYLYLDCDKVSPAGWDIPIQLVQHYGMDASRVRYREDAIRAGGHDLNARYNLLDLHMVIAHREGYGLPHGEAMATGIPSMAIDYCSGREIIGDNERGALVKAYPQLTGTWGGALDYNADLEHLAAQLRYMYDDPDERRRRGKLAQKWAKGRTWQKTAEAVEAVVMQALDKRAGDIAQKAGHDAA